MNAGNIYHYPNYPISNVKSKNKFLVLLNTPIIESHPLIFCLTTSQRKHRTDKEFCQPEHKTFLILSGKDFFHENTWLIFENLEYITKQDLADLYSKKGLVLVDTLQEITVRQIKNCLKKFEKEIKRLYRDYLFICD